MHMIGDSASPFGAKESRLEAGSVRGDDDHVPARKNPAMNCLNESPRIRHVLDDVREMHCTESSVPEVRLIESPGCDRDTSFSLPILGGRHTDLNSLNAEAGGLRVLKQRSCGASNVQQ